MKIMTLYEITLYEDLGSKYIVLNKLIIPAEVNYSQISSSYAKKLIVKTQNEHITFRHSIVTNIFNVYLKVNSISILSKNYLYKVHLENNLRIRIKKLEDL
jgi:hypothetical protein